MGLYQLFAAETKNFALLKNYYPMQILQANGLVTLRHLCGFSIHLKNDLMEPLKTYGEAIKVIFGEYIILMIIDSLEVIAHRIKERSNKPLLDLLAKINEKLWKDIEHPQWIWNESTRTELNKAIKEQLEYHHTNTEINNSNCMSVLAKLQYTAHKDEIIVDGMFARILNKDPYMRLDYPSRIMKAIIQEIDRFSVQELETYSYLLPKTISLLEALNNIFVYQKGLDLHTLTTANIKALCKFLNPAEDKIPKDREKIYDFIFSIIIEISKDIKAAIILMSSIEYQRLSLYILTKFSNEYLYKRIFVCLESIINIPEVDEILINTGLIVVFLKLAFDEKIDRKFRTSFYKYFQIILSRRKYEGKINSIQYIIPKSILDGIIEPPSIKPENWIEYIDREFCDLNLIWDKEIRSRVNLALEAERKKIEESLKLSQDIIVWKEPETSYISAFINKGEIVVSDVILRVFINTPHVRIKKPITVFLDELSDQILLNLVLMNNLRSKENVKKPEEEKSKAEFEEFFDSIQKGTIVLITAFLLTNEQILMNAFNINKIPQENMYKRGFGCIGLSAGRLKEIIGFGLRAYTASEIIVVLLELIYFWLEHKEVFEKEDLPDLARAVSQFLIEASTTSENIDKSISI